MRCMNMPAQSASQRRAGGRHETCQTTLLHMATPKASTQPHTIRAVAGHTSQYMRAWQGNLGPDSPAPSAMAT